MERLVLYGSGKHCRKLCIILKQLHVKITAVLDSDPNKWGNTVEGYLIEAPERLRELQNAYVCIAVTNLDMVKEIREELRQMYGVAPEREIHYNRLLLEAYENNLEIYGKLLVDKRNNDELESILFGCLNGFILGGIEEWTIGICEALIKSGREKVYVIAKKGSYDVPDMLSSHMIYADVDADRFSVNSILNMMWAIIQKLPCKIITTQPDGLMLAAYLVKRHYPGMVEIISTIREGREIMYDAYIDFRKCPDLYIGVSQDIKHDMIQRGVNAENVLTMSVPFVCEKILDRTYTEDNFQPIRLGYAGRMVRGHKRMDLMLKLLKELDDQKVNFTIELAGDGAMLEEMEEFVRLNDLSGRVSFLGRIQRSEIPEFWKRQDICINISDYEGRSHSVIEAMGNGAVPVVTATSGVREDITDGVNGYIVSLEDYHAMAEKVVYLAEHRERLHEMGRWAHDAVYPKSQMENHLSFWEDVFSHKSW